MRLPPRTARSLRALATALALAAGCGAEPIGAAVGDGSVRVTPKGGAAVELDSGLTPFGNGALAEALDGPATLAVAVGAEMGSATTVDEQPLRGVMNVTLAPGAQLRRREGAVFDLLAGDAEIVAGPLARRVVVFHGAVFLEVHETAEANRQGARLRVTTAGEEMTVHVEAGEVLVHAPVSRPGDLHYASLLAGEFATAKPGEIPTKNGR